MNREHKKYKGKYLNPTCIKEVMENYTNNYDTTLKSKKSFNDGYDMVTKIKRNFK